MWSCNPCNLKKQTSKGLFMSTPLLSAVVKTNPGPEHGPSARLWQGIPGVERSPSGRLWATWYTGGLGEGAGNFVVVGTSSDDAATWAEPVMAVCPADPGCREFDPVLWLDPTGKLWLIWSQSQDGKHADGRCGVWAITTDNPDSASPTWTSPRWLCNGVMMNKPTVLSNGHWLFPVALWKGKAVGEYPDIAHERFSNALVSTDQGKTFTLRIGCDIIDRSYDEHMFVEKKDGRLWCLVRTFKGISQAFSNDEGLTWTAGTDTGWYNPNSRFFIRRLASGRLLLVKHDLPADAPAGYAVRSHLAAYLSDDDGESWSAPLLLDERAGVSYPDGVQAPDGRIYVIYDFNRGCNKAALRDREILLAVFREEDVLARRFASAGARQKQVVSKGTGVLPE
jgi:hypothetical protein